jgi:hypothetical protein
MTRTRVVLLVLLVALILAPFIASPFGVTLLNFIGLLAQYAAALLAFRRSRRAAGLHLLEPLITVDWVQRSKIECLSGLHIFDRQTCDDLAALGS